MTIRQHYTLHLILSFMKGLNILKLIATSSKKVVAKEINTIFVNSNDQLVDMLTKSLNDPRISYIYDKFHAYNIYIFLLERKC